MADTLKFEPLTVFDTRALRDFDSIGDAEFYRREQAAGLCALFAVVEKNKRVGSILFCSETKPDTGEKVFAVVAASSTTRRSLIRDGKDLITDYARKTGHQTVKFYTDRPQLAAEFLKLGARAKITWGV